MGPGYDSVAANERVCSTAGSVPGQDIVSGTAYLSTSVMIIYIILFMGLHLFATEYIASERSKGEVLVFSRKAMSKRRKQGAVNIETGAPAAGAQQRSEDDSKGVAGIEKQTSGEPRRILDHVDGWVKPRTLTALMGVSGAGKTTLLDVLATRITMGVISGNILVNSQPRNDSFQHKTGYVTQQDLHLHTSTVRKALNFSALLRQPDTYSHKEKLEYVNTVINLLSIKEYSDAIIGIPGKSLNVEQRKRPTISVELAARPQLLLFLDKPTSGLDSQTS
ncbi:ABC multidrug transporter [Colletotrichum cuscutae]|uniref:ABC multidrug transporter n=1 Tax=Colletotrichum cuscutae TaxID=1209917 RepID=A0AAI9U998_9PEZI|nr:ABC multidrug transporter [Colletotrichum cuscutae]